MKNKNLFFKNLLLYSTKPALVLFLLCIPISIATKITSPIFHEYSWGVQDAMIFNAFLAIIPLVLAFLMVFLLYKNIPKWVSIIIGFIWLLFFPNSIYIITDLIHTKYYTFYGVQGYVQDWVPWAALAQFFFFAFIGCLFGFLSLYMLQKAITFYTKKWVGWLFTILVFGASSIALFLGRVLRFNSWNFFTHPTEMMNTLKNSISIFSVMFCVVFFGLMVLLYIGFTAFLPKASFFMDATASDTPSLLPK